MNTEERSMIMELAGRIKSTSANNKDNEAEELIRTQIASEKDAVYIMTQALLIQQKALAGLQNRIQQLEQQMQMKSQKRGFFGNLFGNKEQSFSGPVSGSRGYENTGYQPNYRQSQYTRGRGSSFLGNAMSTAVGVAGGMALFNGIEHLMSGGSESSMAETPLAADSSFLGGGDGFQGQDNLLDQGFGATDDMSDMSSNFDAGSGFDTSDMSSGFGDGGGFDDFGGDW